MEQSKGDARPRKSGPVTGAYLKRWGGWLRRQVDGELAQGLIKRGSAVLLLQVAGFAVLFLTGILLGRLLGASDYGRYSFAITLVIVFRIGVALGFPMMLLKTVAAYQGTGDWGRLKGLLRFAAIAMAAAGTALAVAVGLGAHFVWRGDDALTRLLLTIALPLIFILPLSEAAAAAIKGLHRIALGQAPELVRALLYLGALVIATVAAGGMLDAKSAMILRVAAESVGFAFTIALLLRVRPRELREAKPAYDVAAWRRGLLGFAAIDATYLVFQQIDILMLGTMRPMADVGVFRMATNLTIVVQFVSLIAGIVLTPTVASAWAQGRRDFLQDICTRLSRIGFAATLLTFAGLMAVSPIIIMILGPDFQTLTVPLAILGFGQFFRAFMPACATVILMTGGERDAAWGIAGAAVINTALNLLLIPIAGIVGAAIATAVSTILLTLFYAVRSYQRTGIDTTIFRALRLVILTDQEKCP